MRSRTASRDLPAGRLLRALRESLGLCLLAGLPFVNASCSGRTEAASAPKHDAPVVTPLASAPAALPVVAPAPALDAADAAQGGETAGKGSKRWRDTGVYLDGKPLGVLSFGELPIALKPVWLTQRVSAEIEPGQKGLGYQIVKQRHYRFTDYLKALGVNLARVKEIHVYGPRHSDSVVATGAELRRRGKDFLFRFGGDVGGKAIPVVPHDFGNHRSPDKISAVMIYIDKKPPTLVTNVGFQLDGQTVSDVPYYGQPLRGGVRIYQDDKLAMSIKRPLLRETPPFAKDAAGTPRWKLLDVLAANGVDLGKVAEVWVIRDERRSEHFTRAELADMTFEMAERGQNQMTLGDHKIVVQALALHARALSPTELPQILPDEEF